MASLNVEFSTETAIISIIENHEEELYDVFTISGLHVNNGVNKDQINKLPKGTYIVKGSKMTKKILIT